MVIIECLCERKGRDGPINVVGIHKIQEELYGIIREIGYVYGCEDRSNFSW